MGELNRIFDTIFEDLKTFSFADKYLSKQLVNVIKLFLQEIQITAKFRNWNKFVLMPEPVQKCENYAFEAKLFVALKGPILLLLKKVL